jgi:uncharacterized protein YbjT (DUF2867 family)
VAGRVWKQLAGLGVINSSLQFATVFTLGFIPFLMVLSAVLGSGLSRAVVIGSGFSAQAGRDVTTLFAHNRTGLADLPIAGLVLAVLGGGAISHMIQTWYAKVFRVHINGWKALARRVEWLAGVAGFVALQVEIGRAIEPLSGHIAAAGAQLPLATAFWWWSPHCLLSGQIPWRRLFLAGLATAVCYAGLSVYMAYVASLAILSNEAMYGPIGTVMTLVTAEVGLGVAIQLGAVIGAAAGMVRTPADRDRTEEQDRPDHRRNGPRPDSPWAPMPGWVMRTWADGDVAMRVLVTGGTGTLGREVVPQCLRRGWTVRVMSRRPRPADGPRTRWPGAEWAQADLATGAGLEQAAAGADVVLHLASLPYRGRRTDAVDIEGTSRLAQAAARAGAGHLVYISIVGVDAIPWPYFRKKLAAEERLRAGPVPWSILRVTQFYPLVDTAMSWAARLPVLAGPADVPARPVDPAEVAARLIQAAESGPSLAMAEFGGPEVLTFAELAAQWLEAAGRRRRPFVKLPLPGQAGRAFRAGRSVPAAGERGSRTWRSWLADRYRQPAQD